MNNYIILDLEATCWRKEEDKGKVSEIIEIGAVKVKNGKVIDLFQQFIRHTLHPKLSDFCTTLINYQTT